MTVCTCGFDNEPLPGDDRPERCAGCGIPLRPADDHRAPFPGYSIFECDDPYVVTNGDREDHPELEGVRLIRELDFRWGDGVGADVYGYHTTKRVTVVELSDQGALPDACPVCDHDHALRDYASDPVGIAKAETIECLACDHVIDEWCSV